jgi:hypothetical protein
MYRKYQAYGRLSNRFSRRIGMSEPACLTWMVLEREIKKTGLAKSPAFA